MKLSPQRGLKVLGLALGVWLLGFYGVAWGQVAVTGKLSEKYVLRPTDLLHLEVYQEPSLEKRVRIEADGSIVLPLVGKVAVGGLTLSQAQEMIQKLYDKDYLVNPQINILVVEYSPRRVQVHGQVNRPGVVEIPPGEFLTLTKAISGANGVTLRADEKNVHIRRQDEQGQVQIIDVNLREILTNPKAKDPVLQDGDIITVRESVI